MFYDFVLQICCKCEENKNKEQSNFIIKDVKKFVLLCELLKSSGSRTFFLLEHIYDNTLLPIEYMYYTNHLINIQQFCTVIPRRSRVFEVAKKPSAGADGLGVPNVDLWIVTLSLSRRRTSRTHPCRRLT